jgi:hypothetical protein
MPLLQPYILDSAAFHDSAYINAKQDTLFEKCLRDDLAKHLKCKYNIGGNPSISKHLRGLNYPKITQEWIEIFTPLDGWDALLLFYQSTVIDKDTITLYLPVVSYSSRKTRYHLYEVAVIRTFKHQKELFSAKIQTAISLKTPIYTRYR